MHLGICSSISIFKPSWLWLKASLLLETFLGWLLIRAENTLRQLEQCASLVAQLVENPPQCRRSQFDSWVGKIPWRRDRLPTLVFLGFPGGLDGKESPCNARDLDSIPGFGRSPRGGHGNPLQYSCLENTMDRGAWQSTAHGFAKSRTRLSRTRKICFLYMTLRNHTNILKLLAFFFSYFKWHISTSESVLIHGPFHFSKFVPPYISS